MKNEKPLKPKIIIDGYQIRKQLGGLFKIVQYSHYSNEKFIRKKTIIKNLNLSDAEDKLYRLESKLK